MNQKLIIGIPIVSLVAFGIGVSVYDFFKTKDHANKPKQNTQKSYDIFSPPPKGFDPTTDYNYLHPKEGIVKTRNIIKKSNKLVGGGKRSKKNKRKGKYEKKNKYSALKMV